MTGTDTTQLILASQSPRRRELLQQMEVAFHVHVIEIDEAVVANELPEDYVERMAIEKAAAAYHDLRIEHKKFGRLLVLGADTSVIINKKILGKPQNKDDAHEQLEMLSGDIHQVFTAVAIAVGTEDDNKPHIQTVVSRSEVEFAELSDKQISTYLETDEPYDKAGSYAIQGLAAQFVKNINGSYSGIMGLPIFETTELLRPYGYVL